MPIQGLRDAFDWLVDATRYEWDPSQSGGGSGTVTSIDVSGGTTGLTFSGGPIIASGTITMAGLLGNANGGTGTSTVFTTGSIVFAGPAGVYAQDNANLFWDDTNNRLGLKTASPLATLHNIGTTRLGDDSANNYPADAPPFYFASALSNVIANFTASSSGGNGAQMIVRADGRGGGNAMLQGDWLGFWGFRGKDPGGFVATSAASFRSEATENWGAGAHGTRWVWSTTPNGTTTKTDTLWLENDGSFSSLSFATKQASVALANGLNSNILPPLTSYLRITGPTGAFSIGGFQLAIDGKRLDVYNTTSQTMTIVNEDLGTPAASRIKTLTGGNITLAASSASTATFIYDSTDQRWIYFETVASQFGYVKADGSVPLTANWTASAISGVSIGSVTPFNIGAQNTLSVFNVVAYGADPTGGNATQTRQAITKACADAAAVFGSVYFPHGAYVPDTAITVTSNGGIRFFGDGPQTSIVTVPSGLDGFLLNGNGGNQSAFVFENMCLTSSGVGAAGAAIHHATTGQSPLVVRNCRFNACYIGIQMNSSWMSNIDGNQFISGNANAGACDIYVNNTVSAGQGDNHFTNNTFWSSTFANIWAHQGSGYYVQGNKFIGASSYGFYCDNVAGVLQDVYLLENNSFEGSNVLANIRFSNANQIQTLQIQNNEFYVAPAGPGINLSPTVTGQIQYITISGNTFGNATNAAYGVYMNPGQNSGIDWCRIEGNTFCQPTTAAIALPATAAFATNVKIGRNNYQQTGVVPYVLNAFSPSSGFDPGIETIYVQVANSVTTANSLTSLLGSSVTIPANRLMAGTQIVLDITGFCSIAQASATPVLTLKLGASVIATVTASLAFVTTLNNQWRAQATITCRSTGIAGTVIGQASWQESNTNNVGQYLGAAATGTVAINTQVAQVIDVLYNNATATGVLTTTEAVGKLIG